ncbi:MAG: hypothetical protein WAV20_04655, partial [Blastocatellia bacterium]
MFVRSFAVFIALALAGSVVCAQNNPAPPQKSQFAAYQNNRIVALLEQLADQARTSNNLAFAIRAQSQAATMLWPQDADTARSIFRRAFHSLVSDEPIKARDGAENGSSQKPAVPDRVPAQKQQLRAELLNQIAARDPELAEELASSLAGSVEAPKSGCVGSLLSDCGSNNNGNLRRASLGRVMIPRGDGERCELLMSAALQIVERDPQQAMSLAQMSVALGISSNLARLLTLMRTVDAERADLLFSNAVARIEQYSPVELTDVHTLGSYVVSVVNSSAKVPISKAVVVRFLNFAFDQIAQRGGTTTVAARSISRDESAALYFIGRQLTELFARYLPDRLNQLQRYVSDQNEASYDLAIEGELKARAPADIARDAVGATDPAERDALYARAALGWLARSETREAQTGALKISDTAIRDRVFLPIIRRYSSEKQIEEAISLARRITDETSRIDIMVMLAGVVLTSKDNVRAVELLNEAEVWSSKGRPSLERARSLIKIASTFAAFDTVRSFEVLNSAVRTINDVLKPQTDSKDDPAGARASLTELRTLDELYAASFESTLAALARADFDRAL